MRKSDFKWDGRFIKLIELLVDLGLVFSGFMFVLLMSGEIQIGLNELTFYQTRDLLMANSLFLVIAFIFFSYNFIASSYA